jgi:hypothetical protein
VRALIIAVVWLGLAYVNAGFMLADFLGAVGSIAQSRSEWRETLGFCIGMSLIPITWLEAPFVTGFYVHGWMRPTLEPPEGKVKLEEKNR